ncbi:MAG: alpha/beta fold hydrolase [Acidobacteria bacterium]|nr:alpha/beta fold hydrolase [Acidobacteriota bacterium]
MPTEEPKIKEKMIQEHLGSSDSEARSPVWEERWATLPVGRMRYLQAGTGRALILIHGLMGYSFSWRFSIPALASHATVYAVDNLGAGFSKSPDGLDCSMRASAERILQFVDALDITDFDLLGTSHGGAVAMMTAALSAERGDDRLKRLVLVAPVNPWSRHGRLLAPFIGGRVGSFLFQNTVARWRFLDYLWLRRMFGDGSKIPPDSIAGYRRPVVENHGFRHGQNIVRTWLGDLADLELAISKIRHYPTLLMWGTRDRAVSFRSAKRLEECFSNCRLVAFKGVGHLPYEEAAEDFNRALLEFLEEKPI